ncbi:hypothetical protein HK102_008698, partial [Quaeritorhiza haematococci]
ISPYAKEVTLKALKDHEAAPLQGRSFFTSLTTAVQYSNQTASGVSIDTAVNGTEADAALAPLTDYLNKNLQTLVGSLSPRMAQEVIKRTWDETIILVEQALIPPLFGQIESTRRVLNKRQISMAEWVLRILKDFFHADGEGLGIPIKVLETRKYGEVSMLMAVYHADIAKVKRDYEMSLLGGREKEVLLRLVRLRIEKQEDVTAADREEGRKWIDQQLVKRRERKG